MTLRSLLCLDYGSGICMAERPVIYVQFSESTVQRAHGLINDHMKHLVIIFKG